MAKRRGENIHDKFFRETFSDPTLMTEFLRHYLPPEFAEVLDWQRLEISKDRFVDEELSEHFSDLLCKVGVKGGSSVFVYILIEHKSSPAPWVALQLLRYMLKIWAQFPLRRNTKLPVIFPLVFYHGKQRWNVARHFNALFDEQVLGRVRELVPDFQYFLCDLSAHSKTTIEGGDSLQAALKTLRGVFDDVTVEWLARLAELLVEDKTRWQQLMATIRYLAQTGKVEENDMQQALKEARVSKRKATEFKRTFLDDWFDQGQRQALLEVATEQLKHRFGALSATWQNRLKRLTLPQLKQLTVASLDFTSTGDLSAWMKEHAN
ncbi:MAG: Rpn family recombination-promoting nuclease/putative transposase [Acidobacteria bacterium]|nr:Rpn family recombination-promoting nuclease/putative transposase [Acidobacteriota bacterium]